MQLKRVIDHLFGVVLSKDLFYINPINLEEEKKRFLEALETGHDYNPRFSYRKLRFNLSLVRREIAWLRKYNGDGRGIIKGFAMRCEDHLSLFQNRGKPDYTKYSIRIFGQPGRKSLDYSRDILESINPVLRKRNLDSREVANILGKEAKRFGWDVALASNLGSRVQVHRPLKILYVSKEARFSPLEIKRITVHEIDTHIKRAFNNKVNIKPVYQNCLDYIETEEGLAMKNEERNNCLDDSALRSCAAKVIAVDMALRMGFLDVFRRMCDYGFDSDKAFDITTRVKRGLSDTIRPGAFTRDHIYISGKLKIDRFLSRGHNIEELFIGKIGIKDVGNLRLIRSNDSS